MLAQVGAGRGDAGSVILRHLLAGSGHLRVEGRAVADTHVPEAELREFEVRQHAGRRLLASDLAAKAALNVQCYGTEDAVELSRVRLLGRVVIRLGAAGDIPEATS